MEKKRSPNSEFFLRTILAGASSVIAACFVHPIDTMKIRLQL
jgi:hypothetical protein